MTANRRQVGFSTLSVNELSSAGPESQQTDVTTNFGRHMTQVVSHKLCSV